MNLDETKQARIETHQRETPAITGKVLLEHTAPTTKVVFNFDLEQQRDTAPDQIEKAFKSRDRMSHDPETRKLLPVRFSDFQWARAEPLGIDIVEYDYVIVGGESEVALDPCSKLERRGERADRVLRNLGAEMQAAMGKAHPAGVERISS